MNFINGRIVVNNEVQQFVSDNGATFPITPGNYTTDQSVIYGIRPEHINIGTDGLPVRVSVLEPTGSETHVFAQVNDDVIDAVVKDRISANPGDELHFQIDPANAQLFDAQTELRL